MHRVNFYRFPHSWPLDGPKTIFDLSYLSTPSLGTLLYPATSATTTQPCLDGSVDAKLDTANTRPWVTFLHFYIFSGPYGHW